MNTTKTTQYAALLVVLAAICGPLQARTILEPPAYIKDQGKLVAAPSRVVGNVFAGIGGIIASPFTAISVPYAVVSGADPFVEGGATVAVGAIAGGEIGYHLGAAPTYIGKSLFYTGPKALKAAVLPEKDRSGLIAEVDNGRAKSHEPIVAYVPFVDKNNYSGVIQESPKDQRKEGGSLDSLDDLDALNDIEPAAGPADVETQAAPAAPADDSAADESLDDLDSDAASAEPADAVEAPAAETPAAE